MKIISWNVNGVRAAAKKGLLDFVVQSELDVLCLQESKAHPEQVGLDIMALNGMRSMWNSAERKGYSGVVTYTKNDIPALLGLEVPEFDKEGRVLISDFEDFLLYNIYFPNGQSRPERQQYKMGFQRALSQKVREDIKRGREVIVLGDYNVAPTEIDVHDPIRFRNTSGFLPEERAWFKEFLEIGFIDTFRMFFPNVPHRYSYWNQIERARLGNLGWRIDHICITKGLEKRVAAADLLDQVQGSDHCPAMLVLK